MPLFRSKNCSLSLHDALPILGVGADRFDVDHFNADFAYTVDGGPVGELQYESFNAAGAKIHIQGKNVHPRSEEHTSELQSRGQLVCRLLLAKKKMKSLHHKTV